MIIPSPLISFYPRTSLTYPRLCHGAIGYRPTLRGHGPGPYELSRAPPVQRNLAGGCRAESRPCEAAVRAQGVAGGTKQ